MATKEIATFDASNYPVLTGGDGSGALAAVIEENFGNDGIQVFDLDRITIPAGGGIAWEIPTLEGPESEKFIEGVIVAWRTNRAYWAESLEDGGSGGNPPDCSSDNGKTGFGAFGPDSDANPAGTCSTCPKNEWGTGREGRGKACSEARVLFMLLPGRVLPVTVSLPVTSIPPIRKYMLRLAGEGIPYYGVVTRLGLRKVESGSSIKYSVVEPSKMDTLDPVARAAAKEYGDNLSKSFPTR